MASGPKGSLLNRVTHKQPRWYRDRGDSVRWMAVNADGETAGNWNYTACYAPIIPHTQRWEVICRPFTVRKEPGQFFRSRLSKVDYLEFMRLCKNVGLVPKTARVFRDRRGNCMTLPRGLDRHTAYVALCMYRFVDCKVKTMRAALRIYRQTGLPWLQVIHYVMATKGFGVGHGFLNVYAGGNPGLSDRKNMALGPALARFGAMTLEERSEADAAKPTYLTISDMAREIVPATVRRGRWGPENVPKYQFRDLEDILDPHLSILYTAPTLSNEEIIWVLETAERRIKNE